MLKKKLIIKANKKEDKLSFDIHNTNFNDEEIIQILKIIQTKFEILILTIKETNKTN